MSRLFTGRLRQIPPLGCGANSVVGKHQVQILISTAEAKRVGEPVKWTTDGGDQMI